MRRIVGQDEPPAGLQPGPPRCADRGIRTAGRSPVVPNDDDIRRAVAGRQIGQALSIWTASDVVHSVTALERLAKCRARRCDIESEGTLEDLGILLDVRPKKAARIVVIQRLADCRSRPI